MQIFTKASLIGNFKIAIPDLTLGEDGLSRFVNPESKLMKEFDATQFNTDRLAGIYQHIMDLQKHAREKNPNEQESVIYDAWANEAMIIINQLAKHILPQSYDSTIQEHLRNDFGEYNRDYSYEKEIGGNRSAILDGEQINPDMQKHPGGVLPIDARRVREYGINWDRKQMKPQEQWRKNN